MRAVWTVISVVLLINTLALAGLVGWLHRTGRLDRQRVHRVRDMFSMTIEEEKQQKLMAQQLEQDSRQQAMEIARLESVSDGPVTLADRLEAEQRGDELAVQRIERLRRDIADMRRQLTLAQQQLDKKNQELAAQQRAFEEAVRAQTQLQEDADFQQTVRMFGQVKPAQAKQMFQELIRQGKKSQVVEYLAAMQLRKAAGVIKTFTSPDEISQATDLLQTLRERGIELAGSGPSRQEQGVNPG